MSINVSFFSNKFKEILIFLIDFLTVAPSSSRAVFLRWFAKKSKQTLALETVNEVESVEKKDC